GLALVQTALGLVSIATSARLVEETVRVRFGDEEPEVVTRLPVERFRGRRVAPEPQGPVLRIVQIADPHLGPWQPRALLERRLARLVEDPPDLVLLTGDFLTMEGSGSRGAPAAALRPLGPPSGRTFAVFGNPDHEAADQVAHAPPGKGNSPLIDAGAGGHT